LLERAASKVVTEAGRRELVYWQSRVEFAVQALIEKEMLHEGGVCLHTGRQAADRETRRDQLDAAQRHFRLAVAAGERAVRATASQIRDDCDRNTLAAYHHFFVREVRARAAELLAGEESIPAHSDVVSKRKGP
jgi:hypothetical protein